MNYAPAGKSGLTSLEFVEFNSSVTLSQLYAVLGKVAKEVGKVYEKTEDETLAGLAQGYYTMEEEAKHLSKLVKKQLQEYDREILESSAILMDACTFDCWASAFVACFGYLDWLSVICLFGCILSSALCGPFMWACFWPCAQVCTYLTGAELIACAAYAFNVCCS